jgi:excisionase family DNA binding protein
MSPARLVVHLTEGELEAIIERAVARALEAGREPKPEHLTAREAAAALRCSDRHVRRLVATGQLSAMTKLGQGGSSRLLVPRSAVEALLAQSTH